jgi:hypothetical protein
MSWLPKALCSRRSQWLCHTHTHARTQDHRNVEFKVLYASYWIVCFRWSFRVNLAIKLWPITRAAACGLFSWCSAGLGECLNDVPAENLAYPFQYTDVPATVDRRRSAPGPGVYQQLPGSAYTARSAMCAGLWKRNPTMPLHGKNQRLCATAGPFLYPRAREYFVESWLQSGFSGF